MIAYLFGKRSHSSGRFSPGALSLAKRAGLSYKPAMQKKHVEDILRGVAGGALSPEAALARLALEPVKDTLNGLTLDTQRELRTNLGEVVFAPNKSDGALLGAVRGLADDGAPVLVSRVDARQGALLSEAFPSGRYWADARLFAVGDGARRLGPPWPSRGKALVMSAGAADMQVAAEAYGALRFWNVDCGFIPDVGVAGLHRMTPHVEAMRSASVIIAVAGMEGALPGVVAGLVPCPVLAVPTGVGYGVGEGGRAALNSMLCSCVPGIAVVNIDNGFGAAAFAAKLLRAGGRD